MEDGLLTAKIELPNITKITGKPYKEGKRIDHNLNNEQFDQLFKFKPAASKLKSYNEQFQIIATDKSGRNKFKGTTLTLNHIEVVKDMFSLMVMAGGLRIYNELSKVKLNKEDDSLIITLTEG